MANKHVCVINTGFSNYGDIAALFKKLDPDIRVNGIVDDSLIQDIVKNGGPTPSVRKRMCAYAAAAQEMGADLILNQCSSAGEVADIYAKLVDIPVLKIDQAMAEKAVSIGGRISLLATVATTVGPSRRLIESAAAKAGRHVEVKECLVDGAMLELFAGHVQKHNDMLRGVIEKEDGACDVIVLAQGSMMAIMPEIGHVKTPVLTSIPLGVARAVEMLKIL